MTPDGLRTAAANLASGTGNTTDARNEGAALARALAAEIRGREVTAQLIIGAVAVDMEMTLLQLAGGENERVAELALCALQELRYRNKTL